MTLSLVQYLRYRLPPSGTHRKEKAADKRRKYNK